MNPQPIQSDLFRETPSRVHGTVDPLVRCISLWQPWASLIAAQIKRVETRSWPAPASIIGHRIGIHAAKTTKGMRIAAQDDELWAVCLKHLPFDRRGYLPHGAILCTAVVERCVGTNRLVPDICGDYSPGRFGWVLTDIKTCDPPIPARGAQGIFTVELSANAGAETPKPQGGNDGQ